MSTIDEKRVYGDREGATPAFVATGVGVARVAVSADLVGEFAVVHRCTALDVAAGGVVAVATDEDVLVGDGESFETTGFGPAVGVAATAETVVAVGTDGRVADRPVGDADGAAAAEGAWRTLGEVPDARAVDGGLVAAAGGVYRTDGTHVGLDDARDVAGGDTAAPLAATGDGLYRLGNGWLDEASGEFRAVAVRGERAHAATTERLYERHDGEWTGRDVPATPLAAVGHGPDAVYAVTRDGTFLVDAGDGWRTRSLGLPDVRALAVPP